MPHSTKPSLTVKTVDKLVSSGQPVKYPDGRSLYLVVTAPGAAQWKGQYAVGGKGRTHCLGSVADLKLADARAAWEQYKLDRRNGLIPSSGTMPRNPDIVPTGILYSDAVTEYINGVPGRHDGMKGEWRGGATGKYARLFAADAKAVMPDGRVLGTLTWPELGDDVIEAYIAPMIARTAKDTKVRLRSIRTYQQTGKLPIRAKAVEHHDAMPVKDVPGFYGLLDMQDERARALAFTILAGGIRISDALGTKEKPPGTWAEIAGDVWSIPANRTKNGEPYTVPLTPAMRKLLGDRKDGRLFGVSYFQVYRYLKKLRPDDTDIHGFRASFRTWMQEHTPSFNREAAELCLQHKIGNETEQAYKRSDLLAARREIMQKWCDYIGASRSE